MKRPLFTLLLLSSALTMGCPQPRNDNVPNVNGPNTNATASPTAGANSNTGVALTRNPKHKAVQIAVYGNNEIAVAPDKFILDTDKGQRLRFSAFNNLDRDIKLIEIIFKQDAEPFDGGKKFEIETIASGEETDSKGSWRKAIKTGKFEYTVRVTLDDGTTFEKDPEVEISGRLLYTDAATAPK